MPISMAARVAQVFGKYGLGEILHRGQDDTEPDPMAAGTIAQVHRATLVGGERVVVKVQRPNAETQIRQDLGLLGQFAAKAGNRPSFQQVVDVPAIIEQLSSSLLRELDFRYEAFGQMQLAAAELDPSLDPFAVAGSFYLRQLLGRMRTLANPQQLFYGGPDPGNASGG
jgi:predicted unusual protein kinase regulating ubiquinone biosynthesis (AarF/ABC1/UbiB family)